MKIHNLAAFNLLNNLLKLQREVSFD